MVERLSIMRVARVFLWLCVGLLAVGCSGNSTSPSALASTATVSNDVLSGTVPAPVGGVLQSAFNMFTVGQGGGSVSVTLTSAIETINAGALLPTVTMGLAVGNASGSTCTPIANTFTTAQAGSTPQLTGTLGANGTYCVIVSDVTTQLGPVAYSVVVSHP
jgi:hypothetical protein